MVFLYMYVKWIEKWCCKWRRKTGIMCCAPSLSCHTHVSGFPIEVHPTNVFITIGWANSRIMRSTHTYPSCAQHTRTHHALNTHVPIMRSTHTYPSCAQHTRTHHALNTHVPIMRSTHTYPSCAQHTRTHHVLNTHVPIMRLY